MRMRRPGCLILMLLGLLLPPAFGRGAHAQAAAAADSTLALPKFPKGKLSPEQLAQVAAGIRRLEANPMAADLRDASRKLLVWLVDSPDITIHVCPHVMPMPGENALSSPVTGMMFLFSSAAFMIENPDRAGDAAAVNLGGIQGVLHSYTILKARHGDQARAASLEALLQRQERGELERHIQEQTAKCAAG
jgi:hypothetical protein